MTTPAAPAALAHGHAAAVAGVRVIDCRTVRPDPSLCPYGLAHLRGTSGCRAFRRGIRAKGLDAPRGGWRCAPDAGWPR